MEILPYVQTPTRRSIVTGGLLLVTLHPARATENTMRDAVRAFVGDASVRRGRVTLDIPALVENGNAVPFNVTVDSPMTDEDHVKTIVVFNEKNPQPHIATFHLGPRCGRAAATTRIRLADSQTVTAIALMSDGSFWSATAEVVVTLAACVEGL